MNHMSTINELDLSAEVQRMHTRDGIEVEMAEEAADLYRKFLALRLKYGQGLTPSKLIDAAWHQHMADTQKYMADCEKICGQFIHHDPKIMGEEMEQRYSYTRGLFQKEFGIDLSSLGSEEDRRAASCGM